MYRQLIRTGFSNVDLFLLREVQASSCPPEVNLRHGLSSGRWAPYQSIVCKGDGKAAQDRPVEGPPRRNWKTIDKGARKREEPQRPLYLGAVMLDTAGIEF